MSLLQKIIIGANFTPYAYSGRGMSGKKCVGFRFSCSLGRAISELLEVAHEQQVTYDLIEAMKRMQTDTMGLDSVMYFEGSEFEETV